jgi:hypothetical protein
MSLFTYTAYWFLLSNLQLFGAIMPLQGLSYISPIFILVVGVVGILLLVCTIVKLRIILQKNRGLLSLIIIAFIYLLALWARNYHDYLQLGQPVAIDGRYWAPILIYLYALMGSSARYTFTSRRPNMLAIKAGLALAIIIAFVGYGGYVQYISHITPIYGRISPTNNFTL